MTTCLCLKGLPSHAVQSSADFLQICFGEVCTCKHGAIMFGGRGGARDGKQSGKGDILKLTSAFTPVLLGACTECPSASMVKYELAHHFSQHLLHTKTGSAVKGQAEVETRQRCVRSFTSERRVGREDNLGYLGLW